MHSFPTMIFGVHQWCSDVKVAQSSPTLWDPMDYTVHWILEARILEWVAVPFSRGSSQPRDRTQVLYQLIRYQLNHKGSPHKGWTSRITSACLFKRHKEPKIVRSHLSIQWKHHSVLWQKYCPFRYQRPPNSQSSKSLSWDIASSWQSWSR